MHPRGNTVLVVQDRLLSMVCFNRNLSRRSVHSKELSIVTPHFTNQINALVLIIGSIWAFLQPDFGSWTVFIPAGFGVVLLACTPGVKAENKVIAHIAVLLTLVVFLMLMVPFIKGLSEGDIMSALRIAIMMATCILAMVAFIKSFRDARRRREG